MAISTMRPHRFTALVIAFSCSSSTTRVTAFAPLLLQQQQQQQSAFSLSNGLTTRKSHAGVKRRGAFSTVPQTLSRQQSLSLQAAQSATTEDSSTDDDDVLVGVVDETVKAKLDKALAECNLRDANRILVDHPGMPIDRTQWDAIFYAIEERTASADAESADNHNNSPSSSASVDFPMQSIAREEMTALYATLAKQDHLRLFGAIETALPPASGSNTIPPKLLESIIDLPMSALTPQPTNTLLLAGVGLAVAEGLTSAYFGISLNALVITTLLIAFLDRLFVNGAVAETLLKLLSPKMQDKILKHEAGHFLTAYLLGCPVEGVVLSAWAALQDRRFGSRQVSAGTSFFDPDLSSQINGSGAVTRGSIDRYSMIVMAGIAAEADCYGRADGGAGDEMALVGFLSQLNGNGGTGRTIWNADSIRNQARWGALQSVLMLREYKPSYDALVDALERGGSLGDCIHAIEKAARDKGLQPMRKPLGYIVEDAQADGMAPRWTTENPETAEQQLEATTATVAEPFDEEASLSELKGYRAQVEEKLKAIEEQLKEIQD